LAEYFATQSTLLWQKEKGNIILVDNLPQLFLFYPFPLFKAKTLLKE